MQFFLATVLDAMQNGDTRRFWMEVPVICRCSGNAFIVLPLLGADEPGENVVTIRLGGPTCPVRRYHRRLQLFRAVEVRRYPHVW